MKCIHITDPAAIEALRGCYANRMNARTAAEKRAANRAKRALTEHVRLTARHEGDPVEGEAMLLIVYVLARCDSDAPTKSVIDACQAHLFAGGDDRVVRDRAEFLRRPRDVGKPEQVLVEAYGLDEAELWRGRVEHMSGWRGAA